MSLRRARLREIAADAAVVAVGFIVLPLGCAAMGLIGGLGSSIAMARETWDAWQGDAKR